MLGVFVFNSILVTFAVVIHYEFLYRLSALIPRIPIIPRFRIVLGVIGALVAHTLEIWLFAFGFYFMDNAKGWGHLTGNIAHHIMDYAYFSFTTYTTLGFGDIEPLGDLTGLVLITWTASFLYYEMQRYWTVR